MLLRGTGYAANSSAQHGQDICLSWFVDPADAADQSQPSTIRS